MLDIILEQAGALSILKLIGSMMPVDIGVLSAYFGSGQDIHVVDILEVGQLMPEGGEILIRAARKAKRREGQLILVTAVSESETDKILAIQGASREFVCYSAREQAVRSAEALQRERFTKSLGHGLASKLNVNTETHAPVAPTEKHCPNCKAKVSAAADRCYLCGMLLSDRQTMMFHKPEFEQCPSCHANMLIDSDECPLCGYRPPKPIEEAPTQVQSPEPAPQTPSESREIPAAVVVEQAEPEHQDDPDSSDDLIQLENTKRALAIALHELMELEARRSVMLQEISDIEMKRYEVDGRLSEQEKSALARIAEFKSESESLSASVAFLESRRSQAEEDLRRLDAHTDSLKKDISARADSEGAAEQQAVFSRLEAGKAEAEALRVEVEALASRREQMQGELDEGRQKVAEMRQRALDEVEADRARLAEELADAQAEIATVVAEKDRVAESAQEIQRQIQDAHSAAEASRQKASQQMLSEQIELTSAAEALRAEIDRLRMEEAQGLSEMRALQEQSDRTSAETASRLEFLRAAMEQAENDRIEVLASIERERAQAEMLREELRGLENQRDEAQSRQQARAVALREEIAGLVDERAEVEREIERFKGRLETEMRQASVAGEAEQSEQTSLESMRAEAEALRTEAESMRASLESMRAELDETSSLRTQEEDERNRVRAAQSELLEQITLLRADIDGAGEEKNRILQDKAQALGELDRMREKSQTARDSLSEEIASMQSTRDALVSETESLRSEMTSLAAEKDDAASRLSALEQEIASAKRSLEEVASEADTSQSQALQSASRDRDQFLADTKILQAEIEEARAQLRNLNDEGKKIFEDVQSIKAEHAAVERHRASVEAELADVRQELDKALAALADTHAQSLASKAVAAYEPDTGREEMRVRLDEALGARDEALAKYNSTAAELELLKMRTASTHDPRRDMIAVLEDERKGLADNIEALRKERDNVRKEKDFEVKSMEILKREIGRWMRERVKVSSENDAELVVLMRAEIDQLRAEKNESQAAAGVTAIEPSQFVAVTEIQRLRDELLELRAQNDSLERAGQKLDAQNRALTETAAGKDQRAGQSAELASRMEAVVAEKQKLEAALGEMRLRVERETVAREEAEQKLHEMKLRVERETAEREEAVGKLRDIKSRVDEQLADRMELDAVLTKLRAEAQGKDAAVEKAAALEEELKRVRADLEASGESEGRAVQLMQELVEERDELARKFEKTGIAAEALKYADDVPRLRKSVAEAADERDRMLEEQQSIANTFKEAVAERERAIEDMNGKTAAASEQLQSIGAECDILASRRDELAADIARLNDELDYYEKKRDQIMASADQNQSHQLPRDDVFASEPRVKSVSSEKSDSVDRADQTDRALVDGTDKAPSPSVSEPIKWAAKAPSRPVSLPTKWPEKSLKGRGTPDNAVGDQQAMATKIGGRADVAASDDLDALMLKAYTLEDAGHSTDAINLYNTIIAMDPKNVRAMHNLALLKYRSGDIDSASQMLEQLVAGTRDVPMETRKLLMEIDRHRRGPTTGWKNIFGRSG